MNERRRFFAEEVLAVAGIESPAMLEAFVRVPREEFLGEGPWQVLHFGDGGKPEYRPTPDADPSRLLHNVAVAIDGARMLNNGQPSSLAMWLHALRIGPADSLLHVGCGTGYYTAIAAALAGAVTAIEVDQDLAERARRTLAGWPSVRVFQGDGADTHGKYDAIFVNAGATHPRAEWLDALRPGGRLLVPITVTFSPGHGAGMMLLVEGESARFTSPVHIFDCQGARDPALEPTLKTVLFAGKWRDVHHLRRDPHDPGPSCVVHLAHCCLSG